MANPARYIFPLILALTPLAGAAADEKETPASPQSIANGKALFNGVGCWSCHGFSGQGAATGPQIGPNTTPKEVFLIQLRTPASVMPPYTSRVLTDGQIGDIYAYLHSLPAPPKAKDIPLLSP